MAHNANKWEVYGGYTFVRSYGDLNVYGATQSNNYDAFKPFNLNGGQVSGAYFPWAHVGIKTEYAYARKNSAVAQSTTEQEANTEQSILIGPTFRWNLSGNRTSRVSLFAHQLFGSTHYTVHFENQGQSSCTESGKDCTAFGVTEVSGGGVDIHVSRHFSLRPAELDYWTHHVNLNTLLGTGSGGSGFLNDANFGASGLRYSAGASFNF